MDISSKFSLYDVLAMIIPGGIIMAATALMLNIECFHDESIICCRCVVSIITAFDFMQCVLILFASYIIGMINNWLCDIFYYGFRNNRIAIENELTRTLLDNENIHLKDYGIILSSLEKSEVKDQCEIIKSIFKSIREHLFEHKHFKNHTAYYRFYYALSRHNLLGSIPMIESQVALLRNSLFPLAALAIALCLKYTSYWLFMALAVIPLFLVMVQRQNKVYDIIWESANYYKL